MNEMDGARLLGHLSLFFVLFALISGVIGARIGRRVTISIGIILMAGLLAGVFFTPANILTTVIAKAPVLGTIPVISLFLMATGAAWSLININSLPMVVDMTTTARVGTFTGLYYLFATLSAIAGPNFNGILIQITGNNYNSIMLMAPIFLIIALLLMLGVKRGESSSSKS
jgi:maltose/moltooligosaccharide transporter